jgi:hypothetical protein
MSRSYKKNPGFYYKDKFFKRYHNKVVRHEPFDLLTSGNSHKKLTEFWNIQDWAFIWYGFPEYKSNYKAKMK